MDFSDESAGKPDHCGTTIISIDGRDKNSNAVSGGLGGVTAESRGETRDEGIQLGGGNIHVRGVVLRSDGNVRGNDMRYCAGRDCDAPDKCICGPEQCN